MKLSRLPIVQILLFLLLIIQMGYTQEKVMVIHKDDGSILRMKTSDIDTLTFIEDFMEDIEGNGYKTVTIGTQVWMAENLRVIKYRNGDAIPLESDNTEWVGLSTDAYCFYDNNLANTNTYGLLYNWYAVDTASHNIAPTGWCFFRLKVVPLMQPLLS